MKINLEFDFAKLAKKINKFFNIVMMLPTWQHISIMLPIVITGALLIMFILFGIACLLIKFGPIILLFVFIPFSFYSFKSFKIAWKKFQESENKPK